MWHGPCGSNVPLDVPVEHNFCKQISEDAVLQGQGQGENSERVAGCQSMCQPSGFIEPF